MSPGVFPALRGEGVRRCGELQRPVRALRFGEVGVKAMVAFRAKPDHFKRLGVVPVVRVNLLPLAEQARFFVESPVADRVGNGGMCLVCGIIPRPPLYCELPRLRLALWRLGADAIIFPHFRVSARAKPNPRLGALPALPNKAIFSELSSVKFC